MHSAAPVKTLAPMTVSFMTRVDPVDLAGCDGIRDAARAASRSIALAIGPGSAAVGVLERAVGSKRPVIRFRYHQSIRRGQRHSDPHVFRAL